MIITIFIFYRHTKEENVNVSLYQSQNTCYPRDRGIRDRERETDVWISKLWLFYVNRNVLILPRLKYFKSPAATIQASVCQALCLSKSQTQHVKTTNILATWIYFMHLPNNIHSVSLTYFSEHRQLILKPNIESIHQSGVGWSPRVLSGPGSSPTSRHPHPLIAPTLTISEIKIGKSFLELKRF